MILPDNNVFKNENNLKNIAVILSSCGVYDGAEIHEATMSMLAIDQIGAQYELFTPDIDHAHVINHLTGQQTDYSDPNSTTPKPKNQ